MGELFGGRFEALSSLRDGPASLVYRGVDRDTGQPCAIKVLGPTLRHDSSLRARFAREIELANTLDHAVAVPVLGQGVTPQGAPFFVMPLVPGASLSDALDREGAFPAATASAIALQLLDYLSALHSAGVVHRDLKPENVLLESLSPPLRVRVVDLGVAAYLHDAWRRLELDGLTPAGRVMGTPLFCAPEQLTGEVRADPSLDLYAAAILLYLMLTGAMPFDDAHDHASGPIPMNAFLSTVPHGLEHVVRRALSADPAARYASAREFSAAIEDASPS